MDELPRGVPQGTPTVLRRMLATPVDETPDIQIKDGRPVSKNPTEPVSRAQFETDEIFLTLDEKKLLMAANEFRSRNDFEGFLKVFQKCTMDIKTVGRHVFVTLLPGED